MILATALVQSLRISEATTASTGTLVKRFKVGIVSRTPAQGKVFGNGWFQMAVTALRNMNGGNWRRMRAFLNNTIIRKKNIDQK